MTASTLDHANVVTTLPQHGDRVQKQNGDTALKQPGVINVTSWEIAHPTCRETCCAAMKCAIYDTTRAYIYVRDNRSIEVNDTNTVKSCCSCCFQVQDNVSVNYFDRSPYSKQCNLSPPVAWICCMPCYFVRCSSLEPEPGTVVQRTLSHTTGWMLTSRSDGAQTRSSR